ncbi:MAG: FMN-binding protein [Desulfitobacterium sp.]
MGKVRKITTALILSTALVATGCAANKPAQAPAATAVAPEKAAEFKVYQGLGQAPMFRVGPGKDEKGGQVYSINYVMADALFDGEGKVISITFDGLEIFSPNDKEHVEGGAGVFSGFPGQAGYLDAASNTDETATKEVSKWATKRDRGDAAYGMNWSEQFATYQEFMKGKTVAEIKDWFAKNTSDINGRPLKADAKDPKDQEKYAKLTDAEKKGLADVTSGATISLKDAHGDFIAALEKAYENRVEITLTVK